MTDIPFDVVAFDLDGTLADTAPDLAAALNHALAALGRETVPTESVRHLVGHGAKALLRKGLAASFLAGAICPVLHPIDFDPDKASCFSAV